MRTKLILDGYNVVHRLPAVSISRQSALETVRAKLVAFIRDWRKKTGFKGEIVIVFDGRRDVAPPMSQHMRGIKILFSEYPETADDLIVSMLKK